MKVRSRLVAREIKPKGVESVFTSTPPWGAFRYLLSCLASDRTGTKKIAILDIKRAFLHTKCRQRGFVQPPHLVKTDRCWETLRAVYGTLTAAADYQHSFNLCLSEEAGMSQGGAFPNCFYHAEKDLQLTYHGDDIAA
eukprot:6259087-Amphidinium_carterae.1